MWEIIKSLVFGPYPKVEHKTGPVLDVTFENCIQILDERLFPVVWFELSEVLTLLQKIEETQQFVLSLSSECRINGVNLTISQNNRVQKMCDMMDTITLLAYPSSFPHDFMDGMTGFNHQKASLVPSQSCALLCPDQELIVAYIAKIRSKLKLIEDMTASKKSENIRFKFSSAEQAPVLGSKLRKEQVFDCNFVRQEIKSFLLLLERLESALQSSNHIFPYLTTIKQKIHRPYMELQVLFAQLPSLTDTEQLVLTAKHDFETAENAYQEHRVHHPILLEVSQLQQGLQQVHKEIEMFLMEYLEVVGFGIIKNTNDTNNTKIADTKITNNHSHSDSNDSIGMNKTSISEEDIRQLLTFLTKVFARCVDSAAISEEDRDILRLLLAEPLLFRLQTLRKSPSVVPSLQTPPPSATKQSNNSTNNSSNNTSNNTSKLTVETLIAVFLKRSVEELETLFLCFYRVFIEMSLQPTHNTNNNSSSNNANASRSGVFKSYSTNTTINNSTNNSANSNSTNHTIAAFSPTTTYPAYSSLSPAQISPLLLWLSETWTQQIPWDTLLHLQAKLRQTQFALTEKTESVAFEDAVHKLQSLRSLSRQHLLHVQQITQRYRQLVSLHHNATLKKVQFQSMVETVAWEELQLQFRFTAG